MPRIIRSRQSVADLREIWNYIARDSEFYADKWIRELNEHIEYIGKHNGRGRPRPELRDGLRSSSLKEHVVFYRCLEEQTGIEVVRILHSARDISPEFFR